MKQESESRAMQVAIAEGDLRALKSPPAPLYKEGSVYRFADRAGEI